METLPLLLLKCYNFCFPVRNKETKVNIQNIEEVYFHLSYSLKLVDLVDGCLKSRRALIAVF